MSRELHFSGQRFTSCDTRTAKSCNGFLEDVRLPLLQTAFSGLAVKAGFRNKASTPYVWDVLERGQASLVEARRCVTPVCSELGPWQSMKRMRLLGATIEREFRYSLE